MIRVGLSLFNVKTCAYLIMHRYVFKYLASSPRAAGYMHLFIFLDRSMSASSYGCPK